MALARLTREPHTCRVIATPWPGVFATDTDSSRHYQRHWHTTFGCGLMERGAHRSMSGRGIVDAQQGDVITTNPGEVHDGWSLYSRTRRWRMIHLEPLALASLAGVSLKEAVDLRITRPVFADRSLMSTLRQLFRCLQRRSVAPPSGAADAGCEELLVCACGLLIARHVTPVPRDQTAGDVRTVRERLADDLVTTPSLSELAAMVGLSRYQLLRRFERVYGTTPFEWQRQLRAERARGLIAAGHNLAQTAVECGFADQSHMTRVFARHFGFTPGTMSGARPCSRRPSAQPRSRRAPS